MEKVLAPTPLVSSGPRAGVWTGRGLIGLLAALLSLDAIGKLIPVAPVIEGTQRLGYALEVIRPLGAVLALSTLLYVVPRTRLVGAVLLTAYLGGATATHVRVGTPFWFPVVVGTLVWLAYGLASRELRSLVLPQPR